MTYKQKTINSMAFHLKRKCDAILKIDAIKELKKIWVEVEISDMVKAYIIAYED